MRILFDKNVPVILNRFLVGHEVKRSDRLAWGKLKNGTLLNAAAVDAATSNSYAFIEMPLPPKPPFVRSDQ